jgi:hypothetical protein
MTEAMELTRRALLATGLASTGVASTGLIAAQAQTLAQTLEPTPTLALRPMGRLVFAVWRNKTEIGRHSLTFSGGDKDFVVAIDAVMSVGLGPITVFKYHHQATETWRDGAFASLQSHTLSNGKAEQVAAVRGPGGVMVKTLTGSHLLPATAMPLTHWSPRALQEPLFNPQTGAAMREAVARQPGQTARLADGRAVPATRYTLSGEADIVDWYDMGGTWVALHGKAPDGSWLDYRRTA